MEKGVWAIAHFMDVEGNILSHTEFKSKFSLDCSFKQYSLVIKAIPVAVKNMFKGILQHSVVTPAVSSLIIYNYNFLDTKCDNKVLRHAMNSECFPIPVKRNLLSPDFSPRQTKTVRSRYLSFPLLPKTKEVHFKTINDIYPSKQFLKKRFNLQDLDDICLFCNKEVETQKHLFFECTEVHTLWIKIHNWVGTKYIGLPQI